jgi:AraC-like DNA-binding protein
MTETVLKTVLEQLFVIYRRISDSPEKASHFRETVAMIYPPLTHSMSVEDLDCITRFLQTLTELLTSARDVSPPLSVAEKRILKIQTYLRENIRISDVAKQVGLSEEALCRFFKKQTSQTLSSYLNEIRIEASAQMLREIGDLVSGVAYTCGFNTVHYFNKVFKQKKGMSPMEYRAINSATKDDV